MRTPTFATFLSVLALASTLTAQSVHDPVPTRIRAETYGTASGTPDCTQLGIWLDCTGAGEAAVQLFGGVPGNLAFLLIGTQPAQIPVLGATALVLPDLATPVMLFDIDGRCSLPVPLGMKELIGVDIYFQGLHVGWNNAVEETFQMSEGLKLSWRAGNPQPPLQYNGPDFTGILVEKIGPTDLPPDYDLFAKVVAPTTGYQLALDTVATDNDTTSVYLRLIEPSPDDIVMPVLEEHRCLIPLGWQVGSTVRVYIGRFASNATRRVYELAAAIETSF